MTEKEMFDMLSSLGIPVAYDHFIESPQGTSVQPPFILYNMDDTNNFKADDHVFFKDRSFLIRLVTDIKDIVLEDKMEDLLNANFLPYEKVEDYIQSERIFQISYYI
jgi:hypothetical protein